LQPRGVAAVLAYTGDMTNVLSNVLSKWLDWTLALFLVQGPYLRDCQLMGDGLYKGTEDVTLWKEGIALLGYGFEGSGSSGGVLGVDFSQDPPHYDALSLHGVPADYDLSPHGLYIDTHLQRLYIVSHSDSTQDESIAVFDILSPGDGQGPFPTLAFKYALTSPAMPYQSLETSTFYFANDLVATSGNELYVTQYGMSNTTRPAHLYHCTWVDNGEEVSGRLGAECTEAHEFSSSGGLNGIAISADHTRLWVNDILLLTVRAFRRLPNSTLEYLPAEDIRLPGMADNVEIDRETGDLIAGMIFGPGAPAGGVGIAHCKDYPADGSACQEYGEASVVAKLPTDAYAGYYGVSAALQRGGWTVLVAPFASGGFLCRSPLAEPLPLAGAYMSEALLVFYKALTRSLAGVL